MLANLISSDLFDLAESHHAFVGAEKIGNELRSVELCTEFVFNIAAEK